MNSRNLRGWAAVAVVSLLGAHPLLANAQQAAPFESDQRVTLAQLLAHAQDNAPAARIARSRLALGDAADAAAAPIFPENPQLEVSVGSRFAGSDADLELSGSLMQSFEIAGERGLREDVASAIRARTESELTATSWTVHQATHFTFHSALVARARVALTERLFAFEQDLLRVAQGRVAAGETSPLVERLAEADVAQARQAMVAAVAEYRSLCFRLGELVGWPTDRPPPQPAGTLPSSQPPPPIQRLLALAQEHNPTLAVRRAAVAEERGRSRLADREGWPQPSIGVEAAREGAPAGGSHEWLVAGVLSIPLPFWQHNDAERGAAAARLSIAEAEHDGLRASLIYRLRRLSAMVEAAAVRSQGYRREVLPRFEENLTLLRRAYELGEIDLLNLSVGRERFLQVQLAALAAHQDYFEAVGALQAVVGIDPWTQEP